MAGPVFAAAVILKKNSRHKLLNDSKQVSKSNRNELRLWIEKNALAWAVGQVSPKEIDEINILNASFLAMHRAIEQLESSFDHLLIDGNRFNKYLDIEHHCIIKGDEKYKSIAAASILAKTHRDDHMATLHADYPEYNWIKNQAYPTKEHRLAIQNFGSCEHHRNSFRLLAINKD